MFESTVNESAPPTFGSKFLRFWGQIGNSIDWWNVKYPRLRVVINDGVIEIEDVYILHVPTH